MKWKLLGPSLTARQFKAVVFVFLGVSALTTAIGATALLRFDATPGMQEPAPQEWPVESGIARSSGKASILVFAHPLCNCAIATLSELENALSMLNPGVTIPAVTVMFFRPSATSPWKPNAAWRMATNMSGTVVSWDDAGKEATVFRARTSGQTLLYNADGKLLFHGGITGSRGHEGDNYGLSELVSAIDFGFPSTRPTLVFGCGLFNRQSAEQIP